MPKALKVEEPATDEPAPAAEVVSIGTSRRVMLVCDHVFLPANLMDPAWNGTSDTKRYSGFGADGKRARHEISAGLAAFLVERDQAEFLD